MNNNHRLPAVISSALMLATLALGWFALSDRLSFPKIAVDRSLGRTPVSEQDVTARLWEDPLQAVQAEVARVKDRPGHDPESLVAALRRKVGESGRVCLLVVPIPGTPFPDDVETRLRLRYSVQMAMAQQGWSPEDRDHLGYVRLNWPGPEGVHETSAAVPSPAPARLPSSQPSSQARSGRELTRFGEGFPKSVDVPYEWFAPRRSERPRVLVLWLPEGLLGREPLCRLAYLRQVLIPGPMPADRFAGLLVVGPRSSDTLKQMVEAEFPTNNHLCQGLLAHKLSLFSPQATAPDALIGLAPTNLAAAARTAMSVRLRELLSPTGDTSWPYFHNFIAPDDQLTDLLVQELALRGVHFGQDRERVLLLAEADTSYGRSLPLAFQTSVQSLLAGGMRADGSLTAVTLAAPPLDGVVANVTVTRYLRGLDTQKGYQGRDPGADGGKSRSAEQLLSEALNRKAAPAFGESQLDYVERLAAALAGQWARTEVRAVGVLGSDLYDKLVLLRSLRRTFPEALFFTTDLDARLWDPEHLRFTRNLVVASAHNLRPDPDRAGFGMPPFRDVYQATVFNACVAALDQAGAGAAEIRAPPRPGLYEIGRHGAVGLAPPGHDWSSSTVSFVQRLGFTARQLWLGWRRENAEATGLARLQRWTLPLLLAGGALGIGVLALRGRSGKSAVETGGCVELFRARTGWVAVFSILTVLGLSLFALATKGMSHLAGAEPWSWSEGVSIWPTELVRLLTIGGVLWMLVWAWQSHAHHRDYLLQRYCLSPLTEAAPGKPGGWRGVWRWLVADWPEPTRTSAPVTSHWINAAAVFQSYLAKAGLGARCLRVAAGAALYFCFGMAVMSLGGLPLNMHIRGDVARTLDTVILVFSVLGLLTLVFYVLDTVWLSAQMLCRIARPFTVWPQPLLTKHSADLGVGDTDLEGYLDVQFAAENTQQVGRLVFLPFLIQFLMLVSRNSYFDNWSWPPGLVFIFVCNMLLAAAAWAILRRAAAHLREAALEAVRHNLRLAECEAAPQTAGPPGPPPVARRPGLEEIQRRIEREQRGAYARWIQDPALLAMMIPTGLLGILSVLFQALFGFM